MNVPTDLDGIGEVLPKGTLLRLKQNGNGTWEVQVQKLSSIRIKETENTPLEALAEVFKSIVSPKVRCPRCGEFRLGCLTKHPDFPEGGIHYCNTCSNEYTTPDRDGSHDDYPLYVRPELLGGRSRFFVDERVGCVAVRDRLLTDPDYLGLHHDIEGVVLFLMGTRDAGDTRWRVHPNLVEEASRVAKTLNGFDALVHLAETSPKPVPTT